jgi:hypothetical protein
VGDNVGATMVIFEILSGLVMALVLLFGLRKD